MQQNILWPPKRSRTGSKCLVASAGAVLAGNGAFSNPLGIFSDAFDDRADAASGGISTTGQLDFGNWFRGDVALFGGASWRYSDRWTFLAEFSPDLYSAEAERAGFVVNSPLNVGAQYSFKNGGQLTASYLYGSTFALNYSYSLDPRKSLTPGGQGASPPPLKPRDQVALASWNPARHTARTSRQRFGPSHVSRRSAAWSICALRVKSWQSG